MKPINNFDKVRGYDTGSTQLPVGGYVLKIAGVRYETGQGGNSDRIVVAFDVAEGDYKGFFQNRYDADTNEDRKWKGTANLYVPKEDGTEQDEWTIRKLKTFTNALQDSNDGYKWDWDESKWKGLQIGGVFGDVYSVINGKQVKFTAFRAAASVENIRKNDYRIPKPQYKNGAVPQPTEDAVGKLASEDFMQIAPGTEEEIPF